MSFFTKKKKGPLSFNAMMNEKLGNITEVETAPEAIKESAPVEEPKLSDLAFIKNYHAKDKERSCLSGGCNNFCTDFETYTCHDAKSDNRKKNWPICKQDIEDFFDSKWASRPDIVSQNARDLRIYLSAKSSVPH